MGRKIEVEEVNGGYMLRAWDPGKMYDTTYRQQNELVVTSKAEAKGQVDNWLEGKAPPFKKD